MELPGETFGRVAFTPGRASGGVVPSVSARPAAFAPMLLTLFLFFLSAAVIYFACEYFVNGVEWVGHRFELGATAGMSTVLAFGFARCRKAQ